MTSEVIISNKPLFKPEYLRPPTGPVQPKADTDQLKSDLVQSRIQSSLVFKLDPVTSSSLCGTWRPEKGLNQQTPKNRGYGRIPNKWGTTAANVDLMTEPPIEQAVSGGWGMWRADQIRSLKQRVELRTRGTSQRPSGAARETENSVFSGTTLVSCCPQHHWMSPSLPPLPPNLLKNNNSTK